MNWSSWLVVGGDLDRQCAGGCRAPLHLASLWLLSCCSQSFSEHMFCAALRVPAALLDCVQRIKVCIDGLLVFQLQHR